MISFNQVTFLQYQ